MVAVGRRDKPVLGCQIEVVAGRVAGLDQFLLAHDMAGRAALRPCRGIAKKRQHPERLRLRVPVRHVRLVVVRVVIARSQSVTDLARDAVGEARSLRRRVAFDAPAGRILGIREVDARGVLRGLGGITRELCVRGTMLVRRRTILVLEPRLLFLMAAALHARRSSSICLCSARSSTGHDAQDQRTDERNTATHYRRSGLRGNLKYGKRTSSPLVVRMNDRSTRKSSGGMNPSTAPAVT